jgi:broad specificity phosphatase PhoE
MRYKLVAISNESTQFVSGYPAACRSARAIAREHATEVIVIDPEGRTIVFDGSGGHRTATTEETRLGDWARSIHHGGMADGMSTTSAIRRAQSVASRAITQTGGGGSCAIRARGNTPTRLETMLHTRSATSLRPECSDSRAPARASG